MQIETCREGVYDAAWYGLHGGICTSPETVLKQKYLGIGPA